MYYMHFSGNMAARKDLFNLIWYINEQLQINITYVLAKYLLSIYQTFILTVITSVLR